MTPSLPGKIRMMGWAARSPHGSTHTHTPQYPPTSAHGQHAKAAMQTAAGWASPTPRDHGATAAPQPGLLWTSGEGAAQKGTRSQHNPSKNNSQRFPAGHQASGPGPKIREAPWVSELHPSLPWTPANSPSVPGNPNSLPDTNCGFVGGSRILSFLPNPTKKSLGRCSPKA